MGDPLSKIRLNNLKNIVQTYWVTMKVSTLVSALRIFSNVCILCSHSILSDISDISDLSDLLDLSDLSDAALEVLRLQMASPFN